ncbi:MAG TPA: hypothetical protein VMJ10_12740 [Kofleriaceae bacterium]|nr:hypothetical protein [Kofleriaceae bacterium]
MARRLLPLFLLFTACKTRHEPEPRVAPPAPPPAATPGKYDQVSREDFNKFAVRLNLPIYWIADANHDNAVQPAEVAPLLFYPTASISLADAYPKIVAASKAPPATEPRIALVDRDLDASRAALVRTDLAGATPEDRELVAHMLEVAHHIDTIYAHQNGAAALASQLPGDPDSASLFRRNLGPKCVMPGTEKDPKCSAIPGAPKPVVDVYPADMQKSDGFCKELESRPDANALLGPFTAVIDVGGKLAAQLYSDTYKDEMTAVAKELDAAADALKSPSSQTLATYLHAAAKSFTTDVWLPADEAWAKMNVDNSAWYVRVGPDEVYWDPCSHKAGFHLTLAMIDHGSKVWQDKLVPVQQEMEAAVAARAGAPYAARKVTFHLPDFIDIVINAGNDRQPSGATIGESLPNWGPVANEGRGRTVAMVNLFKDPDSLATRHAEAASLLDDAAMKAYRDSPEPGLLATILHEATHNLGPAHEYKVGGKTDTEIFGGEVASVLEELKAQTGALFLVELLRGKGIISDELARQTYTDCIVWAFGQVAQGMYTTSKKRKTYSNLAAVQLGFLLEHGALSWDDHAAAANGTDHGAFAIHLDKMPAAADELMKLVAGIKARGDKAAADALLAKYVDGEVVPQKTISERFARFPRASFVYSIANGR